MSVKLLDGYPQSEGAKIGSVAKVTGPSSYATGGFTVEPVNFALSRFEFGACTSSVSGTYFAEFIPASADVPATSALIRVRVAATGLEVAALTDLSAEKFLVRVIGL